MRLNKKVAVITGGNSGIGFATAKVFLDEGAKVIITGRNPETLAAAQKELGDNVLTLKLDVTDVAATEAAFAEVAQKFGRFDVVFANAGIGGTTPLGQTSFEQFNQIDQFSMVIGAALAGLGFALLPLYLIEQELRDGELVMLFEQPMRTENDYYLVVPEGKLENPLTQVFCQWIAGQVGNTDYSGLVV